MKTSENSLKSNQSKLDTSAYLTWVEKAYIPLFDFLYSRLAITKEIKELTTKTFEEHTKQLDKSKPSNQESFNITLYQIANKYLIDYLEIHDLDEDELARFECDEDQQYIQVLLQTLASEYQNLISLKFFTEMNNRQIATILKTDDKKLKKTMQTALVEFKKAYVKFNPDSKEFDYETNG